MNRSHILFLTCILFFLSSCREKSPEIEWQKTYGGSLDDEGWSVVKTPDSGFVIAGFTQSTDGDVKFNHGFSDYWIVKFDSTGNMQWQKTYGGSYYDQGQEIKSTSDGGFLVGGHTYSYDGDVHGNHGRSDEWVIKLNEQGNIQWQKTFGGTRHDFFGQILHADSSHFIIVGTKGIEGANYSVQEGMQATFADEIDEKGNVLWEKDYTSVKMDSSPIKSGVKGLFISGTTISFNTDLETDLRPNYDFSILKIDTGGNLLSQQHYGGKNVDGSNCLISTKDGGYVMSGYTNSNDGDVKGNHGMNDFWIVKLDSSGKLQWQHCYGGLLDETASCIVQTPDEGFIAAGSTSSLEGDVDGNHGLKDGWIIKIDQHGKLQWQKCIGGSGDDNINAMALTNHGILLIGTTSSDDGDVASNRGKKDLWIVKLKFR